jgi:putative hemin transport protein
MVNATHAADELKARVAERLEKEPRVMTPTLAREFDVPEVEILRAHPADKVTELNVANGRMLDLIQALESLGRVHVIASNEGCVLEAYGYFGGFSETGPFFNVQTKTLDMHIKHNELAAAFTLIKPSHQDGQKTYSIQFFTKSGRSAFKVFLYKSVSERDGTEVEQVVAAWEKIKAEFA